MVGSIDCIPPSAKCGFSVPPRPPK
uniref:Uncharacterized protein n=1 Tax=Rhizophora mucronata TaxID=61149 RepID=A0A2P2QFT8_RHIMU